MGGIAGSYRNVVAGRGLGVELARGIDPGRPGVPEFGRRLDNLSLPKVRKHLRIRR